MKTFLASFILINLLYILRGPIARFVDKHIVCDGWEDSEGFHRGRKP